MVQDCRSWYIGDETTVILGHRIRELQEICFRTLDEEHVRRATNSNVSPLPILPAGILGLGNAVSTGTSYSWYPQLLQSKALWHVYLSNVAPFIALLHKPSIDYLIHRTCASRDSVLDPA
jgi:hypothetical protein